MTCVQFIGLSHVNLLKILIKGQSEARELFGIKRDLCRITREDTQEVLSQNRGMNMDIAKPEAKSGSKAPLRATAHGSPRKGPPKFKQRNTRQFKSKPPKRGVIGFGEEIPGMEGLGTDITVICPWEAYSHLELHELAQYGII
ncbi:retinal cone rhodopsin-sensitive cGMP 3',5'-cyclic phosphodiesterase subunit gamma-like isoform X1 [Xiphophorus couchianus]|nr:retinal cone rhodopsin-sensitive cGMP 3',5'-cyclic phosphodiesterase subunit gamma-like isoform X1 [Xiphophorus couchianus]